MTLSNSWERPSHTEPPPAVWWRRSGRREQMRRPRPTPGGRLSSAPPPAARQRPEGLQVPQNGPSRMYILVTSYRSAWCRRRRGRCLEPIGTMRLPLCEMAHGVISALPDGSDGSVTKIVDNRDTSVAPASCRATIRNGGGEAGMITSAECWNNARRCLDRATKSDMPRMKVYWEEMVERWTRFARGRSS